jgi:hypothetical protein
MCERDCHTSACEGDQRKESNNPALSPKAGAFVLATKAALLLPITV